MSDGLGLNHFSDGLPYAPMGSKRRFEIPPPRAPRVERASVSVEPSAPARARQKTPSSAGFVRRIAAFAIDFVAAAAIFVFIAWSSFALNGYDLAALLAQRGQLLGPLFLFYVVVHCGYFLVQETAWRRTLGKALLGLRIEASSGFATVGRAACFFVAAIPFGIGLFWYFFDARRRCWHDVITDTEVVSG